MSDDSEGVGYKRPPTASRWKKGQSGNPKGRTKGQRNLKTDLAAEMAEMLQITERGRPKRITKQRALLKAITARALGGDARATSEILDLVMRLLVETEPTSLPATAEEDQATIDSFLAAPPSARSDSK